jgi:hypothetical protein
VKTFSRYTLVVFFVFLGVSCGEGVHRASNLGQPIATLEGKILGTLPDGISPDSLRASLIWETLPEDLINCMDLATDDNQVFACATLTSFKPALATKSVTVESTFPASFEIPLYTLPQQSVLSSSGSSLFGYGILVVYQDGNSNNELDLVPRQATTSADTILASGLPSDKDVISFIAYQEGGLSPLWKLFSILGCDDPGQGFYQIRIDTTIPGEIICNVNPVDDITFDVYFEDSENMQQLICEPEYDLNTYPDIPPPADRPIKCHNDDSLEYTVDPSSYCKTTQVYQLAGCYNYFGCTEYDWDLTRSPPEWWPCTGEPNPDFPVTYTEEQLTFTDLLQHHPSISIGHLLPLIAM